MCIVRVCILLLTIISCGHLSYAATGDSFTANSLTYKVLSEDAPRVQVALFVGQNRQEVEIPASVMNGGREYAVTAIGAEAFAYSRYCLKIHIPASVTDIGTWAFAGCSNLTAIEVDSSNPAYTSRQGVLFDKQVSTLIAFPGCAEGDYDVPATVTKIGDAAFYGSHIGKVTFPPSMTIIGEAAFATCYRLHTVHLPAALTQLGPRAFHACFALTAIEIPRHIMTIEDRTFQGCSSLASVVFPYGLRTIGASAFSGCRVLPEIVLPATLDSFAQGAFTDCDMLATVTVDAANESFSTTDGVLFNKQHTALLLYGAGRQDSIYTIPEGITTIADYAFTDNLHLQNAVMPQSLQSIGICAFRRTALRTAAIPDGVSSIGEGAFQECMSLTSLQLPPGLTEISDRLCYMTALEKISLPPGIRRIGKAAFSFSIMEDIYLPDAVETIDEMAFKDCSVLRTVSLGNGLRTIGTGAFASCMLLRRVEFGMNLKSIGQRAFYGCWNLREANLPAGVADLGAEAFCGCLAMWKIVLPPEMTMIGSWAFDGCKAISDMFVLASQPPLTGKEVFSVSPDTVRFYIPVTSAEAYSRDPVWKKFDRCEGIRYNYLTTGDNSMEVGTNTRTLLIAPLPATSAPIISSRWSSDNPDIAAVDSLGMVRTCGEGSATIWYIATDSTGTELSTRCLLRVSSGVDTTVADDIPHPADGVYTLDGVKIADLYRHSDLQPVLTQGIYIIRRRGKVSKIYVPAEQEIKF